MTCWYCAFCSVKNRGLNPQKSRNWKIHSKKVMESSLNFETVMESKGMSEARKILESVSEIETVELKINFLEL